MQEIFNNLHITRIVFNEPAMQVKDYVFNEVYLFFPLSKILILKCKKKRKKEIKTSVNVLVNANKNRRFTTLSKKSSKI